MGRINKVITIMPRYAARRKQPIPCYAAALPCDILL